MEGAFNWMSCFYQHPLYHKLFTNRKIKLLEYELHLIDALNNPFHFLIFQLRLFHYLTVQYLKSLHFIESDVDLLAYIQFRSKITIQEKPERVLFKVFCGTKVSST